MNFFIGLMDQYRLSGKKVVFTNGVFDIIHPGHVDLLEKASKLGNVLVVGINSDASVKELEKGRDYGDPSQHPIAARPINPAKDRANVLDAIKWVNYVIVFDEKTPLRTIKQIMPDVLVKGKDWDDKGVVGRDVVEENGGEVVTLDLLRGYSTTDIIERCWRSFSEG